MVSGQTIAALIGRIDCTPANRPSPARSSLITAGSACCATRPATRSPSASLVAARIVPSSDVDFAMYSSRFSSRSISETSSARRTCIADGMSRSYSSLGSRVEKIVRLSSNSAMRSKSSRLSSALPTENSRSLMTTGFCRKSNAPTRRPSMALSRVPCAVRMMNWMSGLISRMRVMVSRPSMPGILRSQMATSKEARRTFLIARSPSSATSTA